MLESSACQSGFVSRKRGKGGRGGGLKGVGRRETTKREGDVNSQIGSFSCFPLSLPLLMDGLTETGAHQGDASPLESWGNGGERGLLEPEQVCWSGYLPEGCKERNGPRKQATSEKPEDIFINCLQVCPVCNSRATTPEGEVVRV